MLLDEIIDILADDTRPATSALLKTKVLLHRLGVPDLVAWVSDELNGYPDGDRLPSYRTVPGKVMGNVANIALRYSNHPIPIGHLPKDKREMFESAKMNQPLATLENLVQGADGILVRSIPMEFNHKLGKQLESSFVIESAWTEISKASVVGIISQVRSRLLDFLLDLRGKIGAEVPETQVAEAAKSLNLREMFNGAVFGDHTTLLVGSHNVQTIATQIKQGDEPALLQELRKLGIVEAELTALTAAIDEDRRAGVVTPFEGKSGAWYMNLLRKAARDALSVGTDVVTGVVAKLLSQYLGVPGA